MKNILVVCESLRINGTSSGIVSSTFITLLNESGYSLKVISPDDFDYPITWLPNEVTVRKFKISLAKTTVFDTIPKVKALPSYLTGFSKGFRNTVNHYKKEIEVELSLHTYDAIYALGSGSAFAPHFALAEMKLDIPYYVNIHDPFPMHVYPEPYKKSKTWVNALLEKKFAFVLQAAKGISFPSQLLMEGMSETFPIIKEKGFVIPHIGAALTSLPSEHGDDALALNASKITILHAGTLLGPRNPAYLLKAIGELNVECPEIMEQVVFTFVGKVNKALTEVVNSSKISNVTFLTSRFSYQKSLELINQAQALFVIEAISTFSPFLPGKIADIAYAVKPIISLSPKNSEVRRLLGSNYPYQTELDNVKEMKQILLQFITDFKSDTVNDKAIVALKNYVSVAHNSEVLKQIFK